MSESFNFDTTVEDCRTDFLFSNPTSLQGAGTVFNIAGNYYDYNYSETPAEADRRALQNDWGMVGKDFRTIIQAILGLE